MYEPMMYRFSIQVVKLYSIDLNYIFKRIKSPMSLQGAGGQFQKGHQVSHHVSEGNE